MAEVPCSLKILSRSRYGSIPCCPRKLVLLHLFVDTLSTTVALMDAMSAQSCPKVPQPFTIQLVCRCFEMPTFALMDAISPELPKSSSTLKLKPIMETVNLHVDVWKGSPFP